MNEITNIENEYYLGSGISGLTSAFLLSKKHEYLLYEKNVYIRGHINKHEIYENDKKINVDSGFESSSW